MPDGGEVRTEAPDVDLLRRIVTVSRPAVRTAGKTLYRQPKAHKTRTVSLPRFLVEDLATQGAGKSPEDLLFGPIDSSNFRSRTWDPALRQAGVERLRIHDLRHTAASLAIEAGANVKGVQRMLGHASAAITLDVYADLFDGHLEAVASALDAARTKALGARLGPDASSVAPMRAPRNTITAGQNEWGGWGSNPRPTDYESAALTG